MHWRRTGDAKQRVPFERESPAWQVAAVECSTPILLHATAAVIWFAITYSENTLVRTFAMTKAINTQNRVRSSRDQILFSTDVEGRFKLVNAAGARVTGYSCEELLTLDVFDLLPETSKPHLRNYAQQALRRRFGTVFEIGIITRSGRQVVLETSLAVIRQPDRSLEFRGVAVALQDVSKAPRCLDLDILDSRCPPTLRAGAGLG
jgi:PAS domain S-box-containing protein